MTDASTLRVFTQESANRTLPLVRRIVEDIVVQFERWQARVKEFEVVSASHTVATPEPRAAELEQEMEALARELEHYKEELAGIGVELKDYVHGLVDFPAVRDGRPIYLCWRLGEPSVEYWHEVDAGFPGRIRLDPIGAF